VEESRLGQSVEVYLDVGAGDATPRERELSLAGAAACLTATTFARPRPRVFDEFPRSLSRLARLLARASLRMGRAREERALPGARHRDVFAPVGAVALLRVLRDEFPAHRALLADFDELPPSDASGAATARMPGALHGVTNAPIVSGSTGDFASYLVPHGTADVFFPTDFAHLAAVYADVVGREPPRVLKSRDFLAANARAVRATATRSGFNPMLDDFDNTSVLVVGAP